MTSSLDRKRIDDLMEELSNLKKSIGGSSKNCEELGGIWKDYCVDEDDFEH